MTATRQSVDSIASTSTALSDDLKIRPAELKDLEAITTICNYAVAHTTAYKFGRYLDVIIMEKLLDGSRK